MESLPDESRVLMALKAIQNSHKLSIRAAAKIYKVPATTIRDRCNGRPTRRETPANSRKLTDLEERAIIQYVLELGT